MNQLTVLNQNGQLLVESREVAEMIGKQHAHLMRDISGYLDILGESNYGLANFFITHSYSDAQGKDRPCFLLTKKGCDMVANKMTGEKGVLFTAAYVTQFEQMEQVLKDPYANLSQELKAVFVMDTKVQRLETRIEEIDNKVETQITLTLGEQRRIQKAVSARVYTLEDDAGERPRLFRELHREIKDRWGVPSYRDLLHKDHPSVIKYIDAWYPRKVS
ncbi:MAG TPA: Rha family transcriptional regulator [Candidatus Paenibacillus intestinavium]|nr:Rha family transcriptional regulator [Candidatus Paenibacillus intestinavium]